MSPVIVRKHRWLQRPFYADLRIVPSDSPSHVGDVADRHLVEHLRVVRQCYEGVAKTLWNIERVRILCSQRDAAP